MKTNTKLFAGMAVAIAALASTGTVAAQEKVTGWGDFKLYLDPGHSGHENAGLWGYSEAEKTLSIALNIKDMLETYTDMPAENLKLCRYNEVDVVSLQERTDEANAWGADFFYAIHSDAGANNNTIVLLFGGWMRNGEAVEKTPNGGKAYGEILNPNLSGVMRVGSRGNYYDRCFYYPGETNHANQYPYLHVNRESNMASLLSEGAYHTIAYQQSRNMNKEYKRLEAFAAFQSLLKYHGMEVPSQTFLHGEIYNSENDQRINGAVVTLKDGDDVVGTYTTDSYETLFNKYSKNPDLIHNGLYTFEGLEAGKEYTLVFEAEGFKPETKTVTINGGGDTSDKFMTFQDVALENNMPAKVDAISIANPESVSPVYPVTITFSRNMVRSSVEEAFSVNNDGEIGLKWLNDYTLELDLSELLPLWEYTITIDGSIAKNSQTNQLFDGDADGEPGGDWVYSFTMAEPDLTAPQIVSTYPPMEGEVKYATRFPIRIEYDEEIAWNEDHNGDCIVLEDSEGNTYAGVVTHTLVRDNSVLHFYPATELPLDRTFRVTVKEGLVDLYGNATEPYQFRFMSEYRRPTAFNVLLDVNGSAEEKFWAPGGSGSSSGLVIDDCSVGTWNGTPFSPTDKSMAMNYVFDEMDATEVWQIREYTQLNQSSMSSVLIDNVDYVLTYWMFGDGSNNSANMLVRAKNGSGGLKMRKDYTPVDFRGWNLFVWDMVNDEYEAFTGTEDLHTSEKCYFDSFFFKHEWTDPDDEDEIQQAWSGTVAYHQMAYSRWDNNMERQASLSDVEIDGVNDAVAENNTLALAVSTDLLTIKAGAEIVAANVYGIDGAQVAVANGQGTVATARISNLTPGVYIVSVKTVNGTETAKFIKK